jgi:parvulin-like peptidyl-prolyl isomerase
MQQLRVKDLFPVAFLLIAMSLVACSDEKPKDQVAEIAGKKAAEPVDIVARVNDEIVTYGELNSMLNSSAMVGLTIPALGTPGRNKMMLAMLDKLISANLLYLDAKDKGTDRLTSFKEDVHRFEDAILASMYKSMLAKGNTRVSELDVLHYYNTQTSKEAELTDDTRLALEAMIRKQKMDEFEANLRSRLREDVDVVINEKVLSPDYDDRRSDADVVASYNTHRITWSQVKDTMLNANRNPSQANFYIDNFEERVTRLQQFIDNAIMALKGRAAGLENDTVFIERTSEYRKARLINEHRNSLIHNWNPSDDELNTYFVDNMDTFSVPEARRVQMLVVKTREEAESIKAQIDEGEMTLGQAAQQLSIDPNAKYTQGDMGWISKGTEYQGLEELIFQLEPELVSDPVESDAGWHLLKVLAVVAAREQSLEDPQTRQRAFRAYMQDRLNNYIVDLRKNHFDVIVYQDELQRQFQREAELVADLNRKAQQEGFVTKQHIEEIQQSITQPSAE